MRDFTLIYGCMFAGKTTELIGQYNASTVDNHERLAVKPLLDNRYQAASINTHSGLQMPGHRIAKAEEIYTLITPFTKELYIDEVQFMGPYVIEIIGEMMMNGVRVVAAGLDKDYLNRDFGPMRALKNLATNRIQVYAKCNVCGGKAQYTYRQSDSKELVLVGHNDAYQARCLEHWEEAMKGRL